MLAGDGRPTSPIIDASGLPDYLNSLDAMADAQQKLYAIEGGWVWYMRELHDVIAKKRGTEFTDARTLLDATAAEKAEAFLRALGKWKD